MRYRGTVLANTTILVVLVMVAVGIDMFLLRPGTYVPRQDDGGAPESRSLLAK